MSMHGYYNGESIVPLSGVNLKKMPIMPIEDSNEKVEYEIVLKSVYYEHSKTKYIFDEPYYLTIRKEKGNDTPFWYCAEDETLGIDIMEESLEEAVISFYSDIDFLWNCYAIESDDKLAEDAVILKNKVKGLIREAIKL